MIVDMLIQQIESSISQYREEAQAIKSKLTACENKRTKIINMLEEAEYHGLDRRIVAKLENKLSRPYAFSLLNIK